MGCGGLNLGMIELTVYGYVWVTVTGGLRLQDTPVRLCGTHTGVLVGGCEENSGDTFWALK